MTETDVKICRICLKNDEEFKVSLTSSYHNFFVDLFGFQDTPFQTWLCCWCKAALRRSTLLIEIAKDSQLTLKSHKIDKYYKSNKVLYNFGIQNNLHVDIPPDFDPDETNISEEETSLNGIEETESEIKLETSEHEEKYLTKRNENEEIDLKVKKENSKRNKRDINCKELEFEVKYLSVEEQVQEIEIKKQSEKYKMRKYKCENCGVGFLTEDVFGEHMKRHEKTANTCTICHLNFNSKDVLTQHSLSHRRRFTCLLCGDTFVRWRLCIVHRYKCGNVQSSEVCYHCKKIFSDVYSLDVHIKGVHKKEKKHACEECGRSFVSKHRLSVHMRTHTGVKLFPCSQCARAFATNSNLRAHSAVHTAAKQYYCVECDRHFKTEKALRRHFVESSRHLEQEKLVYKCPQCTKQFPTEKVLNTHIHSRHLTTYRCFVCNKTFSNNTNLRKHVRCIHAAASEAQALDN